MSEPPPPPRGRSSFLRSAREPTPQRSLDRHSSPPPTATGGGSGERSGWSSVPTWPMPCSCPPESTATSGCSWWRHRPSPNGSIRGARPARCSPRSGSVTSQPVGSITVTGSICSPGSATISASSGAPSSRASRPALSHSPPSTASNASSSVRPSARSRPSPIAWQMPGSTPASCRPPTDRPPGAPTTIGRPPRPQPSAALWACEGTQRVVHAAQHVHGGIGVDLDFPVHRYFRWAKDIELQLGGASASARDLGAAIAAEPLTIG